MQSPQDLTSAEKVRLDGYYWVVMEQMEPAKMLVDLGLFESTYEQILRYNVQLVFTTPYSRAWWKGHSTIADPATVAIVNDELTRVPIDAERKRFELISTSLQEQSGDWRVTAITNQANQHGDR